MILNAEEYPPGFAHFVQPLLKARLRALEMMNHHEKEICRYILEAFPNLGRGPGLDEIVTGIQLSAQEVTVCLERLNEIDMLKYDKDTGKVLVLYPLSAIPCPHQVRMKGKKPVYAM